MHTHAPPGKGEAALGDAATPKLTGLPQSNSSFALRQACQHIITRIELLPDNHVHFAREVCASCGRHVKWLSKPRNVARRRLNGFRIAKLLMCPRLDPWETSFVSSVSRLAKLSPRQQQVVDRLSADYLEEPCA
jgi:hypothetical protein